MLSITEQTRWGREGGFGTDDPEDGTCMAPHSQAAGDSLPPNLHFQPADQVSWGWL